jgi:alpha-beta hydrolase superfamily lysophospholipase
MGLSNVLKGTLAATAYAAVGALVVLVIGYIVYLESRPPLEPWHLAHLDEEFTARSPVKTFAEYQALEDRLFAQLSELVYAKTASAETQRVNRYAAGSLADPRRWSPDCNRSFELPAADPKAGVLLLHGMSDSPYSLRGLGQRLNAAGAQVLGLRLPGHGTAPVGLVAVTWQDMAAGVRLALEHLKQQVGERPIYVVGYSNGAALGVHYALQTLEDANLPRLKGLVLLSPAIGVSPAAAFAVWQARLGRLLGLDQLAWSGILPEYDPFKYGSFAVNAGDVVYRLTAEIRDRMTALGKAGRLDAFPPVMAFASVVDATVSTPALVEGLFARLPKGGHELVLFDINRVAGMGPLLAWDPGPIVQALQDDPGRTFTVSLLSNAKDQGPGLAIYAKRPGEVAAASDPGLSWPAGVYSLSHVALPFPPDDALYGGQPRDEGPGLRLGNTALRGERGVIEVPATELMRLRWNPFYPYVEARTLGFLGLAAP